MKNNEELWEIAVRVSLGAFLSSWNTEISPIDILDDLWTEHGCAIVDSEDILVWEPCEFYSGGDLADMIEAHALSIMKAFEEIK